MASDPYQLSEILAIANIHPFYVPDIKYPPEEETVKAVREQVKRNGTKVDLSSQSLLQKKDLYRVIDRLVNDLSLQNTYRRSCYTSTTGGGSGGTPLFFATNVHENRRHRAQFGNFLRETEIVKETDWILTTHFVGHLYRSMDLIAEICENAGATVLCGGPYMSKSEVASALSDYHVNVLAGESSQIINICQYLSTLSHEERDRIHIEKIIYTSEMLTPAQRSFVKEVMGAVKIYSIYGSAEAGPWAVGNPEILQGQGSEPTEDFIFDTRSMIVEILDPSVVGSESLPTSTTTLMPDGELGIIVQTSLHRLRNPLVRYITGDLGSIHPLPECARSKTPEADWEFLRILRLYGRDRRFSFEWDGMYFEFESLASLLSLKEYGVLQWQVILDRSESSPRSTIETRIFRSSHSQSLKSEEALSERIMTFFNAYPGNAARLSVTFLEDRNEFVRSGTGDKIIKFVDRFN